MNDDLALLVEMARAAGTLALDHLAKGLQVHSKPGGSPVTNADLAVDAMLKERLCAARPDYGWLSEETADDPDRLTKSRLFIVDPIDGTSAFLRGKPWWSVSLAVVENGRPIAGVVFAPAVPMLFTASRLQGAQMDGVTIQASATESLEGCAMLGDGSLMAPPAWPPMHIENRNSVAYRMCLVASGAFDAAFAPTPKNEWDLAAADLICTEAGALCTDAQGQAFAYNAPDPRRLSLVCAGPALHGLILNKVAAD